MNDFRVTHPLGKGEVVSSILPGSTRNAHELRASETAPDGLDTFRDATEHEHDNSTRGKSVESVRQAFWAWCTPQFFSWPPEVRNAATCLGLSLDHCAEYPDRATFWRMLSKDVAKFEAAITHAS